MIHVVESGSNAFFYVPTSLMNVGVWEVPKQGVLHLPYFVQLPQIYKNLGGKICKLGVGVIIKTKTMHRQTQKCQKKTHNKNTSNHKKPLFP